MRDAAVLKFKETGCGVCGLESGGCCGLDVDDDDMEGRRVSESCLALSDILILWRAELSGMEVARRSSKREDESCQ